MTSRTAVFLSIWLVAFSFLLAPGGCRKEKPAQAKPAHKIVDVEKVPKTFLRSFFTAPGRLEPVINVSLSAQLAGQLLDVSVNEGTQVKMGQTVAVIDGRELVAKANEVNAELVGKQAAFDKLKNIARPQELSQLEANAKSAKEALDVAEKNLERLQSLYDEGVISLSEVEKASAARDAAEAAYIDASAALSMAKEGARKEDLLAAEAAVKALEARLDEIKIRIDRCTIKAPIDGVISKVYMNASETVQAGTKICDLISLKYMQVKVGLSEGDLVTVQPGARTVVKLKLAPDNPLPGVVTGISPNVDPASGTYTVEVSVPNPGNQLLGGMFANVEFTKAMTKDALVVPLDALSRTGDTWHAFVVNGGAVEDRKLTVGITTATHVQVLEGLSEGELLVVKGQGALVDGDLVEIGKTLDPSIPDESRKYQEYEAQMGKPGGEAQSAPGVPGIDSGGGKGSGIDKGESGASGKKDGGVRGKGQ